MMYRFILISMTLLECFITNQGFSQQFYKVKGNIYNNETNEPVSSANIEVVNAGRFYQPGIKITH